MRYLDITRNGTTIDLKPYVRKDGFTWTRTESTVSVETIDGKTHRGIRGQKAQLNVALIPLKTDDYNALQNVLNGTVNVHYVDPILGERRIDMYTEELKGNILVHYADDTEYWDGIELILKEY